MLVPGCWLLRDVVPKQPATSNQEPRVAQRLAGIHLSLIRQINALATPLSVNLGIGEPNVEPDDVLRAFMQALWATFPQWPPYEGVFTEVLPHATLGEDVDAAAVCAEIERRVRPHLPRRCQAEDVALLEEFAPDHWRERERFAFGG